jgi:hypothetical protein
LPNLRRETLLKALDQIRTLEADIFDMDRVFLSALKPYQKELDPLQTISGLGLNGGLYSWRE